MGKNQRQNDQQTGNIPRYPERIRRTTRTEQHIGSESGQTRIPGGGIKWEQ